jgi:hypothetical protein
MLVDMISNEELQEAGKKLEFGTSRSRHCPEIEELANFAVWPQRDPVLPHQLSVERRAEIKSHMEQGCPACRKQIEIAKRRSLASCK